MLRNTNTAYGTITKLLHWLMFLMFVGMVVVGYIMTDRPLTPEKLNLYSWHKSFGMTLLVLAVVRLVWRWGSPVPALPEGMPKYQRFAAHASHYVLYFLMFLMPLSGWLMSSAANVHVVVFKVLSLPNLIAPDKGLRHLFEEIHETGVTALEVMVGLHATAALVHHYFYKDNVLVRMLPFRKEK